MGLAVSYNGNAPPAFLQLDGSAGARLSGCPSWTCSPGTPGIDSQIALLSEFLAQLGVQRPHVAGNAMGGLRALEMAARGLVASATALSPAGFASRGEMTYGKVSLWLTVRLAPHRPLRGHDVRDRVWPEARAEPVRGAPGAPDGRRGGREHACAGPRALVRCHAPALRATEFSEGRDIEVPLTVAWGAKDRLLLPRQARRAAHAIPRARVLLLDGCGHVPTWDDPEQVARVLLEGAAASRTAPPSGAAASRTAPPSAAATTAAATA